MAIIPKWLRLLVLGAVVAAVAYLLLRPTPIRVELGVVEARPFYEAVDAQGRTRGINPYLVTAPVGGRLLRTDLEEGDTVSAGQLLARIAPTPQDPRTLLATQANLAAAEARHRAAEAVLEEARSALARITQELERRETLFRNNLASVEETETYRQLAAAEQARVRSAEAALQAAAADIESVRAALLGTAGDAEPDTAIVVIDAPVTGTVYHVFEENERVIPVGTPLFEISNEDALEVVADILTQDAVAIDPGDRVYVTGWGGDQTLNGVVRTIEPEAFTKISALGVEEQRVNVIIDLLDAPPNLGAEYRVEVAIVTWQANEALTIPTSAIFQRSDGWNTFVLVGDRVETRPVLVGGRGRDLTRVLGGIEAGARVVLYPSDLIEDGAAVSF